MSFLGAASALVMPHVFPDGARESGVFADVRSVEEVGDLSATRRVVLGSAVCVGRWLEPARRFVEEHADELAARATWLFPAGGSVTVATIARLRNAASLSPHRSSPAAR